MRAVRFLSSLVLLCVVAASAMAQVGRQQFADLGDCKLQGGDVIHECRVGYRTFGTLNSEKSNSILFLTWASGTTEQLTGSFAPGGLADSSKYFVVAIDALGNGVSSSPSNSKIQPRMKFPKITIRDMVESQHRLLTEILHLQHVKAVIGVSMGGMQAFQWMVLYPEFMDRVVPIAGSPRLAPYDLVFWQAEIDSITNDRAWNGGDYTENPAQVANAEFGVLVGTTPQQYNRLTTREQAMRSLEKAKAEPGFDANNHIRQAQAMMALDVSDAFGGSIEKAAASVKAKVLVVVSMQDHTVTPGPALDFAKRIHAEVLAVDNDCGHQLMSCDAPKLVRAVVAFLEQ